MKRETTQEEREKIVRAIADGDRIRATSILALECVVKKSPYRSLQLRMKESGLTSH